MSTNRHPGPPAPAAPTQVSRPGRAPLLALPLLALLLVAPACKSAAAHRADADEEVYEIIRRRREDLGFGMTFTIEPPAESLRKRVEAAAASGAPLELEPLGLVECLEIAAENSRDYQRRREFLYLAALDLTLEQFDFRVQQSGTFGALVTGTGRTADSADLTADFGLTRLFGTGAFLVGNVGLDMFRTLSTGDDWDLVSTASFSISQPLLRGYGSKIVREPLTQAERNVLYEVRAYERFRRTFAFDVAERFFRIVQQMQTLDNERLNRDNLAKIRERNAAWAAAGRLIDMQVDQARQDELRATNRVIDAERSLQASLDDFKIFLGLPLEFDLRLRAGEMEQLYGLEIPEVDAASEELIDLALARRLDHLVVQDQLIDAERKVRISADALRMGLDVEVGGSVNSDPNAPFSFDGPGPNSAWDGSVTLDLPLNRMAERNAYRTALINREVAFRAQQQSADFVAADVRDAVRTIAAAKAGLSIQENSVVLAERRVESSNLNLEAGRAQTRDLLESQEALVEARNAAVQSRVDFALASLALYRDLELLRVDEGGLRVDTGPLDEPRQELGQEDTDGASASEASPETAPTKNTP